MPNTLFFGDFTVLSKEGYDLILDKLSHFNMKKATPRKGFDPKGYIYFSRKKTNLGGYVHIPYTHNDIIRNMKEREAKLAIDNYNREIEQSVKEIQEAKMLSYASNKSSNEGEPRGQTEKISKLRIEEYQPPNREEEVEEASNTDTR